MMRKLFLSVGVAALLSACGGGSADEDGASTTATSGERATTSSAVAPKGGIDECSRYSVAAVNAALGTLVSASKVVQRGTTGTGCFYSQLPPCTTTCQTVQLDVGSSADVNFEAAGPGYTPVDGVGDKAVVYMSTSKGNSIASVTAVKGTRSVTLTASSALPEEDAKQRAIAFVKDVLDD